MKSRLITPRVFIKFSNEYNYLEENAKGIPVKSKADVRRVVNNHKFYDKSEFGQYRNQNPQWAFRLDIAYAFDFCNIKVFDIWRDRIFLIGNIIDKKQGIARGFDRDNWLANEEYSLIEYPNGYMDIMDDSIILRPGTLRQINPMVKTQKESELDRVFAECKRAPLYEVQEIRQKSRT